MTTHPSCSTGPSARRPALAALLLAVGTAACSNAPASTSGTSRGEARSAPPSSTPAPSASGPRVRSLGPSPSESFATSESLRQSGAAQSRDRKLVALPIKTFEDECELVEVVIAKLGETTGDRFLARTSGACSAEVKARVQTAELDARLAREGFVQLSSNGGYPLMQPDELEVKATDDPKGFDFTVTALGDALGKPLGEPLGRGHVVRQPGYTSTKSVVAYGERTVVYVSVAFEESKPGEFVPHKAGPGLARRAESWVAIPLSKAAPLPLEDVGAGRGTEDPADVERATGRRCERGSVMVRADVTLQRCDRSYKVIGAKGETLVEGEADPRASVSHRVLQADFGRFVCVEVDSDAGDSLRCVNTAGETIAQVAGPRLTFYFFDRPPVYLRVGSYAREEAVFERLAWDGKRFERAPR